MKAEALILDGPGQVRFGTVDLRDPKPGEVLCETVVSLVSTGTEMRVWSGKENGIQFPLVPGYSAVARVVKSASPEVPQGTLVYAMSNAGLCGLYSWWGSHASHTIRPVSDLPILDERVSPGEWAFLAPLAVAIHGEHVLAARPGQKVAVFGMGLIGTLAARVLAARGCRVAGVETDPRRLSLGKASGTECVVDARAGDPAVLLREHWPEGADLAVEATGSPKVVDSAIACLRTKPYGSHEPSPVLLLLACYTEPVAFQYRVAMERELVLRLSNGNTPQDLLAARDLIGVGRVQVRDMITLACPAGEAPSAYEKLRKRPAEHLTALFEWKREKGT